MSLFLFPIHSRYGLDSGYRILFPFLSLPARTSLSFTTAIRVIVIIAKASSLLPYPSLLSFYGQAKYFFKKELRRQPRIRRRDIDDRRASLIPRRKSATVVIIIEGQIGSQRHNAGRINRCMTEIIVLLDMIDIDRRRNPGYLI
jgi:hypothetical protein